MNTYEKAKAAAEKLRAAYNTAIDELTEIVKEHGGFIDTRACDERPTLYAMVDTDYGNAAIETSSIPIHGIRYDEDSKGLFIITDTELDSYAYDNGYNFEYYYNFEGEDAEHLNDAMKDITYFRDIDDGYTDIPSTIFNIVGGLYAYLNEE